MTLDLFLRLYGATCIGIGLVTWWSFPLDPLRRWLARGPYMVTDNYGDEWRIMQRHQTLGVYGSRKEAASHLKESDRLRAWVDDLTTCPFCFGAWAAALALAIPDGGLQFADRVVWWPLLWWASSVSVALVKLAAER